jgi:putative PIN family toxin of toxin-antitoxin system
MTSKRVVFDTNVLISALLFENSTPARAFFAALRHDSILVSLDTLQELQTVIKRKKFDKYVTIEERDTFITLLTTSALLVEITESIRASQDSKDDKFLEVAINGQASYIVTGDPDLLVLHPFRNVNVVSPANFLAAEYPTE